MPQLKYLCGSSIIMLLYRLVENYIRWKCIRIWLVGYVSQTIKPLNCTLSIPEVKETSYMHIQFFCGCIFVQWNKHWRDELYYLNP